MILQQSPDLIIVTTPVGDIAFSVRIGGKDPQPCVSVYKLTATSITPVMPSHMSVEQCVAVLLSLQSDSDLFNVEFIGRWLSQPPTCTGPETGEALDAQGWESDRCVVLIGTEDEEFMAQRLDPRVELGADSRGYPVEYSTNGLRILVQKVPIGVPLSLHFLVAWNPNPEPVECSCWYAVGAFHQEVLSAVHKC